MSNTTVTAGPLQLSTWPREQMQPVIRLEYQRAYPEGSPLLVEVYPMSPHRDRRVPGHHEPPMRDALSDIIDFLSAVSHDLNVRGLHCLEITVAHEPAAYVESAREQGWQYSAVVLAVPVTVIFEQQKAFDNARAEAEAKAAADREPAATR